MDEIARTLRSLHAPVVEAYCLAEFEGRKKGGWLGRFARDVLEDQLEQYRERADEDQEGED